MVKPRNFMRSLDYILKYDDFIFMLKDKSLKLENEGEYILSKKIDYFLDEFDSEEGKALFEEYFGD